MIFSTSLNGDTIQMEIIAVPADAHPSRLVLPIAGAIAALGVVVVVGGIVTWSQPWGSSLALAGGVLLGAALLGWWMRSWIVAVASAIAAAGMGMIVTGIGVHEHAPTFSAPLVAGGLVSVLLAAAMSALARVVARSSGSPGEPLRATAVPPPALPAADQLARVEHLLHELYDAVCVSDAARKTLYPPRDLEVIHHRLEQALAVSDFAAAEGTVQIADSLGHEALIPALRARIAAAHRALQHAQAAEPLQAFEAALARRDWADAFQHAAIVRSISQDAATAAHLDQRVQAARQEHKQALERQFLEAGERDEVETAMATLKELDRYMTREEADRLSRDAQRVIQRHRERLSASFQAAVQDKRWADAARAGNSIIAEYPNTRMAEEVRTMIEVIRTRATQTALARE